MQMINNMSADELHDRLMQELAMLDVAIYDAKNYGSSKALHTLAVAAERAAKITYEMERRGLIAGLLAD